MFSRIVTRVECRASKFCHTLNFNVNGINITLFGIIIYDSDSFFATRMQEHFLAINKILERSLLVIITVTDFRCNRCLRYSVLSMDLPIRPMQGTLP